MNLFSSQENQVKENNLDEKEENKSKGNQQCSFVDDISSDIIGLEDEILYDSIKECEEYFELEERKCKERINDEKSVLIEDILISSNDVAVKRSESRISDSIENDISKEIFTLDDSTESEKINKKTPPNNEKDTEYLNLADTSDLSSKRHKSSSSIIDMERSFIENKENRHPNSKNKENECFSDDKIPGEFIEELISSLQENNDFSDFSFCDDFSIDKTQEIGINLCKMNKKIENNDFVESEFRTAGKNKTILIDQSKLNENVIEFDSIYKNNNLYQNNDVQSDFFETGFTTGKNKVVSVNKKTIISANVGIDFTENSNIKSENIGIDFDDTDDVDYQIENIAQSINSTNEKITSTYKKIDKNGIIGIENKFKNILCDNYDSNMIEIFNKVLEYFKKEDQSWVFHQFKWTWLHLFVNNTMEKETLFEEIIEIMKLRMKYEKSILRRIVEFDDVSFRFMILGVIDFSEKWIELFDGFYSIKAEIDKPIYQMLQRNKCTIGTRLFVFGSEILLKEPTSIFEVTGCALRLFYNSIKICFGDLKLGLSKKISFLNTISTIRNDGGVVSALIVKIKKIIEAKYYVSIENYKNRVDDIEKEIEKILEIASKTGHVLNIQDIKISRYCKVLIEDNTGECQLTWWTPPDIKEKEEYKFVYLKTVENSFGLHLTTTRQTYFENLRPKK